MNLRFALLIATSASLLPSGIAGARELINYKDYRTSTQGRLVCGPNAKVRVDAPSDEHYHGSRVTMQELANVVKTHIWIGCPEIEHIEFVGFVDGEDKPVFSGAMNKDADWFLGAAESPDKQSTKPSKTSSSTENFSSLNELKSASNAGELKAQLELARGLLGVQQKFSQFSIPKNLNAGRDLLEPLVQQSNAEALQILAEAYLNNQNMAINFPLVSRATGQQQNHSQSRQQTAAQMSIAAAALGSESAVEALNAAGAAGSPQAFMTLARLYNQDKGKGRMPYRKRFLKKMGVKQGRGKMSAHRMSRHFYRLAASAGSQQAADLLKISDEKVPAPGSLTARGNNSASSNNLQAQIGSLAQSGRLQTLMQQAVQTADHQSGGQPAGGAPPPTGPLTGGTGSQNASGGAPQRPPTQQGSASQPGQRPDGQHEPEGDSPKAVPEIID